MATKKTSTNNKGLTEVVFIIDRSGSMGGSERDTINGFNTVIREQLKDKGDVIVSTVLFDNTIRVLHDRIDIRKVEQMTTRDYVVGGSTSLLDAVGGAIDHIGRIHKYSPPAMVPKHTMIVIITDGGENSSTKYTYERVKFLVENQKKKYNWILSSWVQT